MRSPLNENGCDRIQFLISTNPGEEPKPLSKIASGGELSRIMLALKTVLARHDPVDTMIFDEVDAGVGGLTLNKVAERLEALAQRRQMLLITHWPQLASRAFRHFRVTKQVKDGKTFTQCIRLDERERKTELARMAGIES